jgi:hypothetical protein
MLSGLIGVVPAGAGASAIVVSPTPVAPGADFTVEGPADCILGDTLTVSIADLQLSQDVSGDAAWSLTFTVPTDAAPGSYPVVVTGEECSFADGSLVVALVESISLVKTVGTTAGACATTTTISVVTGTTVYFCYTVTNDTQSTLATHNLSDDELGVLLTDAAHDLAPGATTSSVALGETVSAVMTATTTNTATWTAYTQPGVPFADTASATVTVTAVPAVAAAAAPNFTG